MPLQQIRPDFSGSEASMQAAQRGIGQVGQFANEWMDRIAKEKAVATEQARYDTEQARQGVLDERATQLWNEQQKEKENILIAGQLRANPQAATAAILAQDPRFDTAMEQATSAGMDTGAMGVEGVMDWYSKQTKQPSVNLTASVPNVGGSVGGAIYKNVATGTTTQPVVTTPTTIKPGATTPTTGLGTPQATTAKVVTPTGTKDYTNALPKVILGAGEFRPLDAAVSANKKAGEFLLNTIKGAVQPAIDQFKTTKGKGGYQDKVLTEAQLNPKAPLVEMNPKMAEKVSKTLDPKTPGEKTKSKETVTKTMEKVLVGYAKGTPPKLNQIEASTIDSIFSSIDPNAQSRDSAKTMIEGLYYSLGLSPKQVKEYSEGTVESVYGDKNDPIKLAVANAKLNVLQKNVDATNELGMKMYSENRADARQALQLSHSERLAKASTKAQRDMVQEAIDKEMAMRKIEKLYPKALTPQENIKYQTDKFNLEQLKRNQANSNDWNPFT